MITYNLFQSSRNDCNETCIKNSASSSAPALSFTLPGMNDTLVDVTAKSGPELVNGMFISIDYKSVYLYIIVGVTTVPPINYEKGNKIH